MNTHSSIEEYLQSIIQKIPKLANMENIMSQSTDSSQQDNIDTVAALTVVSKKITACVHHTSHTMLNPNPSYQFANNPGIDACSHPVRLELVPANTFLPCQAPGIHALCSMYSPDYKIIKKFVTSSNSDLFYYLTKYRNMDGSYSYKIYDSLANLYFDLSYKDVSDKDSSLDAYAEDVIRKFFEDSFIQVEEVYSDQSSIEHAKPNNNSYLATLIS